MKMLRMIMILMISATLVHCITPVYREDECIQICDPEAGCSEEEVNQVIDCLEFYQAIDADDNSLKKGVGGKVAKLHERAMENSGKMPRLRKKRSNSISKNRKLAIILYNYLNKLSHYNRKKILSYLHMESYVAKNGMLSYRRMQGLKRDNRMYIRRMG